MSIRIIIIGLSNYGTFLAENLQDYDVEVVAVDKDEERMNKVREFVDRPVIGNATNRDVLEELGVNEADYVIVSLNTLEDSVVCLLYLKELNAKYVIAQAINVEHTKILRLLKVNEIVFPEKDTAKVTSQKLLHPGVVDIKELTPHESLVELRVPTGFVGQTLEELGMFRQYHVRLLLIKKAGLGEIILPSGEYNLRADDIIFIAGKNKDLMKFEESS